MSIQKFSWVAVMDNKTCPDCSERHTRPPAPMSYWDNVGKPREGATICGDACRCLLIPEGFETDIDTIVKELKGQSDDTLSRWLEGELDKTVERQFTGGIEFDIRQGGKIKPIMVKEFEQIKGLASKPYAEIAYMEDLIIKYKIKTDGAKLPKEWFEADNIDLKIQILERIT